MVFDEIGERLYETGVEKVVLYRLESGNYQNGSVWNGVTAISENSEGGEPNDVYADDLKYISLMSVENLKGSIQAYTYPNDFSPCLGHLELAPGLFFGRQSRKHFGLCYKTIEGNDTKGNGYFYKLHIVYDLLASPSDMDFQTVSDSPDPNEMSWDFTAGAIQVDGFRPTSKMVLDYKRMASIGIGNVIHMIEDILYGTDDTPPTILKPSQINQIIDTGTHLCDSDGNFILDSENERIVSMVYE